MSHSLNLYFIFQYLEAYYSSIREKQATQALEFSNNYAGSRDSDVIIIAGDLNSTPESPVYNLFAADYGYSDSLVDR